jgi:hypothetical protein
MRGLTFEKPKKRYSLSECYANFLTILRIYRTTMISNILIFFLAPEKVGIPSKLFFVVKQKHFKHLFPKEPNLPVVNNNLF